MKQTIYILGLIWLLNTYSCAIFFALWILSRLARKKWAYAQYTSLRGPACLQIIAFCCNDVTANKTLDPFLEILGVLVTFLFLPLNRSRRWSLQHPLGCKAISTGKCALISMFSTRDCCKAAFMGLGWALRWHHLLIAACQCL